MLTTEHELIVALCKAHLESTLSIEKPIIQRLMEIGVPPDPGLAELFEEVANMYMDLSEAITARVLASPPEEHASPPRKGSAEPPPD